MAKKNLFARLRNIFSSGRPVVKRKVRNYTTAPSNQALAAFKQAQSFLYGGVLNTASMYDRMNRMNDYQEMDLDPILHAALDLYAEEACSQDENGNVLHIYSENRKIKEILEFLFYETLNVNFFLTPWVRNLPIRHDTIIPLLDNRNITIKELTREFEEGKENWVYSTTKEGRVVPGKINWCGLTGTNRKLVRVWIDDNSYVDTTPEHEFILRNGNSKKAKDLNSGDSLMPFYRGNDEIYNPGSNRFVKETFIKHSSQKRRNFKTENIQKSLNHKVLKVEFLDETDDVYCMEVLGANGEHDRHNFMVITDENNVNSGICLANCKYGDLFLFHEIREDYGVMNSYPIPVNEIEREEGFDANNPNAVRFRWAANGNRVIEDYEMSHFRLLGNDSFLPYGSCLTGESRVATLNGSIEIKNIKIGQEIFCFNADTNQIETTKVLNKKSNGIKPVFRLRTKHRFIDTTDNHPFLMEDGNYKELKDIEIGEKIYLANTNKFRKSAKIETKFEQSKNEIFEETVKSALRNKSNDHLPEKDYILEKVLDIEELDGNQEVWDIEVESNNSNFIANGIVVHNSVLAGGRRIWRQLSLLEDSMMIYRIVRSPERRVFYIDVGNVPPNEVENYMEQVKASMRSDIVVNKDTGTVDQRFNALPVWKETPIPLLDGRAIPIKKLAQEYEEGKTNWVYSIKDKTGEVVPGKVVWCGKNYTAEKLIKVWLDDDSWIMTAPEHPFICFEQIGNQRKIISKRADELKNGDSLVPLETKLSSEEDGDIIDKYVKIYDTYKEDWEYAHRLVGNNVLKEERTKVSREINWDKNQCMVLHHIDFNKYNNCPENLQWMGNKDHIKFHSNSMKERWANEREKFVESFKKQRQEFWNDPNKKEQQDRRRKEFRGRVEWYNGSNLHKEHNKIRKNAQLKSWGENHKERCKSMQWDFTKNALNIMKEIIDNNNDLTREQFIKELKNNEKFKNQLYNDNPKIKRKLKTISKPTLIRVLKDFEFKNFEDFKYKVINKTNKSPEKNRSRSWYFSKECLDIVANIINQNQNLNYQKIIQSLRDDDNFVEKLKSENRGFNKNPRRFSMKSLETNLKRFGYKNYSQFKQKIVNNEYYFGKNHKVQKVEEINMVDDVYCMTVVGSKGENDRHNFAAGTFDGNVDWEKQKSCKSMILLKNSILQDYFLPTRGGESATKIDTLAGGRHATDTEDVEYLLGKLFAAIKIPKAFLQYDEALCLHGDTKVPLLDGRTLTMKEIAEEFNLGKQNWAYSSTLNGEIKPGKITNAWETKKVDKLLKIKLDNDKDILCTENHPFLCRDGIYKRADELVLNESIMPFYTKISNKKEGDFANGYEKVYHLNKNKWVYTHRMVKNNEKIQIHESAGTDIYDVIHHNSFFKLNNNPDKLTLMGKSAHVRLHAKLADNLLKPESRKKAREIQDSPEFKRKIKKILKETWDNDDGSRRQLVVTTNKKYNKIKKMHNVLAEMRQKGIVDLSGNNNVNFIPRPSFKDIVKTVKQFGIFRKSEVRDYLKCSLSGLDEIIRKNGHDSWYDFVSVFDKTRKGRIIKNIDLEKAANIASICSSKKQFYKEFGISRCGFENYFNRNKLDLKKWFNKNLNKNNHKVISIEWVYFDEPVEVYDLTIEKYSNFALESGIFVHNSAKATLSLEDLRFSRTINNIQRSVVSELNKIAIIHLVAHGFDDEELLDFTLSLSNPSTLAEQQKLELLRTKFEIMGTPQPGLFSRDYLRRNVGGLTDEEIEQIDKEIEEDKLFETELETEFGEEGGLGGGGGGAPGGGFGEIGGGLGDEEGGLEDISGKDPEGLGEEPPEDEEEPEEESDDEQKGVLLSGEEDEEDIIVEDEEEEEDEKLSMKDDEAPVKALSQMQKTIYNRRRIKRHGPATTHMPDFNKMISAKNKTFTDPFDKEYIVKGSPFKDHVDLSDKNILDIYLSRKISQNERMASETMTMIDNFKNKVKKEKLLKENNEEEDSLEDIGEENES